MHFEFPQIPETCNSAIWLLHALESHNMKDIGSISSELKSQVQLISHPLLYDLCWSRYGVTTDFWPEILANFWRILDQRIFVIFGFPLLLLQQWLYHYDKPELWAHFSSTLGSWQDWELLEPNHALQILKAAGLCCRQPCKLYKLSLSAPTFAASFYEHLVLRTTKHLKWKLANVYTLHCRPVWKSFKNT